MTLKVDPLPLAVTRDQLATVLGIDKNTITKLNLHKHIFALTGQGVAVRYDLVDNVKRWVEYQIKLAYKDHTSNGAKSKEEADLLIAKAKVRLVEIEADKAEGKVITVEQSDNVLNKVLSAVRTQLLQIPGKWAPILQAKTDKKELSSILTREVDKVLTQTLDNVNEVLTDELLDVDESESQLT